MQIDKIKYFQRELYFHMNMIVLYVFIVLTPFAMCQTDSFTSPGNTGSCKDMLQGFINGQLASTLGTLQIENLRKEFQRSVGEKESEIKELKRELDALKTGIEDEGNRSTSIVYTRWGRDDCPTHSETVYSGFTGGSYYSHTGASAEPLCLPSDPEWGFYTESTDDTRGLVYGAEYEFSTLTDARKNLHNYDIPCAVCRVKERSVVITIPARKSCYPGWNAEYTGNLMAGYYAHTSASHYTCFDENPIGIPGSQSNSDGKLFYPVESRCVSLQCPPYVNGGELTCVVCSV